MNLKGSVFGALVVLGLAACQQVQPPADSTETGAVRLLQVTPSSVLLTHEGQQRELTVRAFDAEGREVPTDALELEWSNSDADAIRLAPSGSVATVAAEVFLGSSSITVRLRSDPDVAAPIVHVVDARLHDDVEPIADARIVFPLVNAPTGAGPDQLPDIALVGPEVMVGTFSEREVADLYELDPLTAELRYPVVLRGEAPDLGTQLLASEGGGFAGVVVARETRGGFSLVQLRPVAPANVFHDLEVAYTARKSSEIDVGQRADGTPHPRETLQQQNVLGIIDACSVEGSVGSFSLVPTFEVQADIDGVLEIRDGDPVPERFMLLVAVNAELRLETGLELDGTMQGKIECELGLAKLDLPFPGYLAPFFSARAVLDSVTSVTVEVTDGPHMTSTAKAALSGSVLVGFDYLSGEVVDLSDVAPPSITLEEVVFVANPGTDGGVVDFRLGSYLKITPGVAVGGAPAKVLDELGRVVPPGTGLFDYLAEKLRQAIDVTFIDMAELEFGPELQATWMGNLAVLDNRGSTSYGGSNLRVTSAIKSDTLNFIADYLGLSALPRLDLPTIVIPGMSFFRPFAPGSIEVTTKTRSGPVGQGEVVAVRAGETIDVFASGAYTFALAPLVDAPLEYGEVWLDHVRFVDELAVGLDNVLAGIITISEEMCGEGPFQLAILGYNRMFTVETAGYMGAITLECQESGVALSPKDLWFGAQVNESVQATFTLTNLDEPDGDLVHYDVVTDGDWLSLMGPASGTIAAGDSVTLGMSGQCPAEPDFLAGSFIFTFVREDAEGELFPLTDNAPASMPIFLQCVEKKEKDDDPDDMGVGTSFGDPWLDTPDGYFYGFQAVGDYILVASTEPSDPFEVQVRYRPFPGNWSANDALAMRVLNSVVNIYATDEGTLEVFIDGTQVSEGSHALSGGGSVSFGGTSAAVTWPDLTQVSASLHRETIGALTVVLPPSRRGKVEGLMGNFDGDPGNDIRIRDGAVLLDPTDEELYQDYRWSWRVPVGSAESLFVQGPEYWDPLYPTDIVRLEDLDPDAVRWAAGICTELGIVDQNVLRSCIFDVALTGDEGWATVAAGVDPSILGVSVTPQLSYVVTGGSRQFGAVVSGTSNREIVWSATGGTITPDTPNIMTFTAPLAPGEYTITARLAEEGTIEQTVTVFVVEPRAVDLGVGRVLAAGGSHSLAVIEGGTVVAWGRNLRGQLGDGTTTDRSLPVEVEGLQGVTAVVGGAAHSLALLDDGTVWAWGSNMRGELGTGDYAQRVVPVQVTGVDDVVMIADGGESSFALKRDGTLWAWGENWAGQLGVSVSGTEVLEPARVMDVSGLVAVAGSYDHTLALTDTGRVWAWGSNSAGQLGSGNTLSSSVPREIPTLDGVTAIAAGYQVSLALRADGSVWTWGNNANGLLGTGDTGDVRVPTRVLELSDVVAIAAGDNFRLALKQGGTVWGWGINGWGQLGNGSSTNSSLPVQVAHIDDATAIVAGGHHGFAIREDGLVWAWGSNASGQLGNGSAGSGNRYYWPSPVYSTRTTELDRVVALEAGMALREDGSLWSWGFNTRGELGVGHSVTSNVAMQTLNVRDPIAFAAGQSHALALLEDGTVWAWGWERYGQLGNDVSTNTHRSVPLPVHDLSEVVSIAAGANFNLALKKDGTVWSWGWNANGELGVGDTTHRSLPVQVLGPEGEGHLSGAVAISAGNIRSFAITDDGTLWAWGGGTSSSVPVVAATLPGDIDLLADLVGLSHGDDHSLALLLDGAVWAWGANGRGQLGDGTTTGKSQAVRVRLSSDELLEDATGIATGRLHSMAVREDGSLWAWGFNLYGQLGNGTDTNSNATPGPVQELGGVRGAAAAGDTSFALLADGTVWAWGRNDSGAIGDGTFEQRNVPVQVLARVPLTVSVAAGGVGAESLTGAMHGAREPLSPSETPRYAADTLALRVSAHGSNPATLEAREGDANVVVLRSSLRAPAESGDVVVRSVTLEALAAGGGVAHPGDLVSGVKVYLTNGSEAAHPVGAPVATGAAFDASSRMVLRFDEPARVRAGETFGLVIALDMGRQTSLRLGAGASLLALLLWSPLLLRARRAGTMRRTRALLGALLVAAMLSACAQTHTVSPPAPREVQVVLAGIEATAQDSRAGAAVTGLPVMGARVSVVP